MLCHIKIARPGVAEGARFQTITPLGRSEGSSQSERLVLRGCEGPHLLQGPLANLCAYGQAAW